MKVDIKTDETTTGMIFKKTYPRVTLKVEFTEEEKAVIEQNKLRNIVVIERGCPMDQNGGKYYPEHDPGFWHVKVWNFLRSPEGVDHVCESNGEIKNFIAQAKENLPKLKAMIEGNATEAEDESFEL